MPRPTAVWHLWRNTRTMGRTSPPLLARTAGRIDHVRPGRVTPLAAPLFLEPGRMPVAGEGRERLAEAEAERLMAAAGLSD